MLKCEVCDFEMVRAHDPEHVHIWESSEDSRGVESIPVTLEARDMKSTESHDVEVSSILDMVAMDADGLIASAQDMVADDVIASAQDMGDDDLI